jgi:hypothetical protein
VVIWIVLLLYKTGLVEHLARLNATLEELAPHFIHHPLPEKDQHQTWAPDAEILPSELIDHQRVLDDDVVPVYAPPPHLSHTDGQLWEKLSHNHWPALLGVYNMSLFGK